RGGSAVIIACAVVGTTLAAAGHVLALAIHVQADERTLVGRARTSGGLAWFAAPDTTMIPQQITALPSLNSGTLPAAGQRFILAAASGSLAEGDPVFTGSIGPGGSFRIAETPPVIRLPDPGKTDIALPLPRMRPQLAALTPPHFKIDESAQTSKTAIYD